MDGIAILRCVAYTSHLRQVKHFLLIGCLGMVLGACVFLWLSMSRPKSSLPHVLMFMATAISAMSFYAMWTGVGVECVPCPPSPSHLESLPYPHLPPRTNTRTRIRPHPRSD